MTYDNFKLISLVTLGLLAAAPAFAANSADDGETKRFNRNNCAAAMESATPVKSLLPIPWSMDMTSGKSTTFEMPMSGAASAPVQRAYYNDGAPTSRPGDMPQPKTNAFKGSGSTLTKQGVKGGSGK